MCNHLHTSYVKRSTSAVICHQVLKEKALQYQCDVQQATTCSEMQTDECDPFRGQRKSRQYKLTELFDSSDLIKGRVGHHLLFIFPTEWHCALSSYLSLWFILFPTEFTDTHCSTAYIDPLSLLIHTNTCCLSSEETTNWSSVGAEYIDHVSSLYIFHKSEDSFIFLCGWKKNPLHWNPTCHM